MEVEEHKRVEENVEWVNNEGKPASVREGQKSTHIRMIFYHELWSLLIPIDGSFTLNEYFDYGGADYLGLDSITFLEEVLTLPAVEGN